MITVTKENYEEVQFTADGENYVYRKYNNILWKNGLFREKLMHFTESDIDKSDMNAVYNEYKTKKGLK